ncbi:MAG TPA: DUF3662 domain-containing protein [Pyrinomonadaceae bacterium]|nr:DUF3662 domain-containing protein [Pyrinomonadaceae bacterium]
MSVLDKVRKWIDGETSELVLEEAARDAQVKPRSLAEEFIVKIAREVEGVMQREIVPLPQGTAIIPTEYTIFLSDDDDKEWQGAKRRGLEQGLYHILAERAKEISGKKKLETKSFAVQLRVDGTLEKGEVRVQHSWEDPNANKTSVLSRPKPAAEVKPKMPSPAMQNSPVQPRQNAPSPVTPINPAPPTPNFTTPTTHPSFSNQPPPTALPNQFQRAMANTPPISSEEFEESTRVQKRNRELYKVEVWRGGVRQNVIPVHQREVVIGRGSKSKPVDIPLLGDPEISRRHLVIYTDGNGNFSMVNEGRNPAIINNYELPVGQQISIAPGVPISICTYMLRIQL